MTTRLSLLFLFQILSAFCIAQVSDSIQQIQLLDSVKEAARAKDSVDFIKYQSVINYQTPLTNTEGKTARSDIQQMLSNGKNTIVFIVLLALLILVTYTRIFFGNEINDLILSMINRSAAMQSLRTQVSELSIASFILHINL